MSKIKDDLTELITLGETQRSIADATGLNQAAISLIISGFQADARGSSCAAVAELLAKKRRSVKRRSGLVNEG